MNSSFFQQSSSRGQRPCATHSQRHSKWVFAGCERSLSAAVALWWCAVRASCCFVRTPVWCAAAHHVGCDSPAPHSCARSRPRRQPAAATSTKQRNIASTAAAAAPPVGSGPLGARIWDALKQGAGCTALAALAAATIISSNCLPAQAVTNEQLFFLEVRA